VGKRIVYVIDDDVAVRDSFHVLLEANDLDVRSYASSETFLNDTPPLQNSCLVIDVNMPDLDGIDLLSRLRRNHITSPAILMTGGGVTASLLSFRDRTGVVLLEKPIVAHEFVTHVKRALDDSRS